MSIFHLVYSIWLIFSARCCIVEVTASCCSYKFIQQSNRRFEQRTDRFWKFSEQADRWIEVELPHELNFNKEGNLDQEHGFDDGKIGSEKDLDVVLTQRKRISLTRMSETSIWVTGESGSMYERFWNGLEWVIAPHDLPESAGRTVAVFMISHVILAISEAGNLYQMHVQFGETSQTVWVDVTPTLNHITDNDDQKKNPLILIKSGILSHERKRAYFCTKNGTLIELTGIEPLRWTNHGQPARANVAVIAEVASIREVVYTISSAGDLYEYDEKSKPSWKRHIWQERTAQFTPLIQSKGCSLHGLIGDHSESLFLLTKEGNLVERRLHQRKWKWMIHGSPQNQNLTSITPPVQDESSSETFISLFFTTSAGSVFEYQMPKQLGTATNSKIVGAWKNHQHPIHARVARGISGLPIHFGRILFPLDDGRLSELHLLGLGGENSGPALPQNFRRKASTKYVWSILDAPESEGWNAEYCTEDRGPRNCLTGIKDESMDSGTSSVRRKQIQTQNYYSSLSTSLGEQIKSAEDYVVPDKWISTNFRLRLMYEGKSFFFIANDGLVFEHICIESVWVWLRHDSSTAFKGIVGNYNGSLFMVDTFGSLVLREWHDNEISWRNCSAMRKGKSVIGGQPWDRFPGQARKVTTEDSLFFVSKNGRLLQFMVYMRKFKWKDCKHPPNVKVASIVDQELFRENIIFVIGRNGRLYQYNKVTDLWHEHYQSQHLILSQFPGTVIRASSSRSLSGSLFMISKEGGLVEYQWNNGWNWVEHGTPDKGVILIGSPGPSFGGNQLLLIGENGNVYLRYMEKNAWKWKDCGFPSNVEEHIEGGSNDEKVVCNDEYSVSSLKKDQNNIPHQNSKCDPKVATTRPIPFSEGSVIFELRDGRLAELQLVEDTKWVWSRIIGTPSSLCLENYWITVASS